MISKIFILLVLLSSVASCDENNDVTPKLPVTTESWSNAFAQYSGYFQLSADYKQFKKSYDFNGDGNPDYIYMTIFSSESAVLPKDIVLVEPWPLSEYSGGSSHGSKHSILIILGGNESNVVIRDKNNLSVLDTLAATHAYIADVANLTILQEPDFVPKVKGDVIVMPTEAGIESYLYWDGKGFSLYEIIDIP